MEDRRLRPVKTLTTQEALTRYLIEERSISKVILSLLNFLIGIEDGEPNEADQQ